MFKGEDLFSTLFNILALVEQRKKLKTLTSLRLSIARESILSCLIKIFNKPCFCLVTLPYWEFASIDHLSSHDVNAFFGRFIINTNHCNYWSLNNIIAFTFNLVYPSLFASILTSLLRHFLSSLSQVSFSYFQFLFVTKLYPFRCSHFHFNYSYIVQNKITPESFSMS